MHPFAPILLSANCNKGVPVLRASAELRVLLVEDEPLMQSSLSDLLDHIGGFQVVATARGEQDAVRWLRRCPAGWDVAIVDLMLAPGSGLNVIAAARAASEAPIAVFSDYATESKTSKECIALGATGVFPKHEFPSLLAFLKQLR
jgi:DNA-binding NarL/FixJ family response regulator